MLSVTRVAGLTTIIVPLVSRIPIIDVLGHRAPQARPRQHRPGRPRPHPPPPHRRGLQPAPGSPSHVRLDRPPLPRNVRDDPGLRHPRIGIFAVLLIISAVIAARLHLFVPCSCTTPTPRPARTSLCAPRTLNLNKRRRSSRSPDITIARKSFTSTEVGPHGQDGRDAATHPNSLRAPRSRGLAMGSAGTPDTSAAKAGRMGACHGQRARGR